MHKFTTPIAIALCMLSNSGSCVAQEPAWNYQKQNPKDAEFVAAKANAQKKWPVFTEHFAKSKDGFVKTSIKDSKNVEHVWVTVNAINGDKIDGSLDNELDLVKGYKVGQKLTVNKSDVEDWFFADGKTQIGGWSVEVYLKRNPELRSKFPTYVQPK